MHARVPLHRQALLDPMTRLSRHRSRPRRRAFEHALLTSQSREAGQRLRYSTNVSHAAAAGTGSPGQPACSTVAIPDRFIIRAPADRRLPPPVANTYALLCWQPACMVPSPADRFERPSACTVPVKRHYVCLRRLSTAAAPRRGAPYSPRSCRSTRDLTNVDLVHTCAARGEPIVWFCRTQRKPSSQTANRRMPLREFSLGGSCAASQAEPPIFVPSGQRGITSGTCHELSPLNSPGRGNHRKQLAQHPS